MGFFKLSAVFLLSLLLWEVHGNSEPKLNCPRHSSPGYTSPCEKTCANLLDPPGRICTMKAIYTCKCDAGLVAQIGTSGESVQCVKPEKCKVPCGPNQHYEFCGSACPPTCKEPKGPKICTANCSSKCVCDKGYVLSENKKCVKERECKKPHDHPHHD
ncbi:zonadhesin-like isoform X1 [Bufo bufo]|uniref:zonadhesin-like isoform X1 n=1 Tax=Bufo bufo TaxID=8384 RepID=UPI001ABDB3BA|nr:zonadhesin-like isoform X1 [Bufo bufo]